MKTTPFWFMVHALKLFKEEDPNGHLPLIGSLPDMKAVTSTYVKLQTIYRDKALVDKQNFTRLLHRLLDQFKLPHNTISEDEITRFCRNCHTLHAIRYSTLKQEFEEGKLEISDLESKLNDKEDTAYQWYIAYRSLQRYRDTYKSFPCTLRRLFGLTL
jgi:NEDD8-activating enzyme E1 regulatory subunit